MLNNQEIENLRYCRDCLNKEYNMDLKRSDIQTYYTMVNVCNCCQQEKHVVYSIKPLSRWKLLTAQRPRYHADKSNRTNR